MKNKIKIVSMIIVLVILAGCYSIVDKTRSVYDRDVDSSEYSTITLSENDEIQQSFVTNEDHLDGVAVKMSVNGNRENIKMHYFLKDELGNILAEGDSTLDKLKVGKFFQFPFEQVKNTKNNKYVFGLKIIKAENGDSPVVFGVSGTNENSESKINGEMLGQTFALRTITHRFDFETFIVTVIFEIYVVLFMRWLTKLFK